MNRSDIVDALAQRTNTPRSVAEVVVHLVFDSMADALAEGNRVEIRGFGSMAVRRYDSYTGKNPKTQSEVTVAPKALPRFKMAKGLKVLVNQDLE